MCFIREREIDGGGGSRVSKLTAMESTRARRMKKKKGKKSNKASSSDCLVEKSTPSMAKDTNRLDPQHMELQNSSPNSSNEKPFFGHCFYRFREKVLVPAWPELESAAKKHGLHLTLHRDNIFYIAISAAPWTRDPDIFDMAKEFVRLLAISNVPPSVAIKILNGDLHHEFIMVGHEKGGLCLKHGITKEQLAKRWKHFTRILQDLSEIVGFTLYYTANSITAVGDSLPHVKLIGHYVEACIVRNMKAASVLERVRAKYDRCVVEMQMEALSI